MVETTPVEKRLRVFAAVIGLFIYACAAPGPGSARTEARPAAGVASHGVDGGAPLAAVAASQR